MSDHESMSHASVASDVLAFSQIPIEWDTDPDDLDYEPSARTASALDESSEHPDDMSIDLDLDLSRAPSPHVTRSRKASSSSVALSVSVALDPLRAPLPTGVEEQAMLLFQLRMTHDLLARELEQIRAQGAAGHACQWCTPALSQPAPASGARAEEGGGERENRKRKRRRSGREKGGARHVMHSAFCERWIAEQRAQTELERDAASRAHQKRQVGQPEWQRIREAVASRVFAGARPPFLYSRCSALFYCPSRTARFIRAQGRPRHSFRRTWPSNDRDEGRTPGADRVLCLGPLGLGHPAEPQVFGIISRSNGRCSFGWGW